MTTLNRETRPSYSRAAAAVSQLGYETAYIAGGKVRITRQGRDHLPSYFDLAEFITLVDKSRQEIAQLVAASQIPNRHFLTKEITDMSTEAPAKQKRAGKRVSGPIPKPSEKKRSAQKPSSPRSAKQTSPGGDVAAVAKKSEPAARKSARARKPQGTAAAERPKGAQVAGATPEILEYLNGFQSVTIERMNGYRVVEFYMAVKNAPAGRPVARRDLAVYPARIARELVRIGVVRQEKVEGIGVCYFPIK